MSKRIPFEKITEGMVLEEYRKQHQHLSNDFQHFEVRQIDNWEEVETEQGKRAYRFVIDSTILNGWQTRYEHYQPIGWLFHLTECTEEDEEDQGDFLGHYLEDGDSWS